MEETDGTSDVSGKEEGLKVLGDDERTCLRSGSGSLDQHSGSDQD